MDLRLYDIDPMLQPVIKVIGTMEKHDARFLRFCRSAQLIFVS